MNQIPQNLLIIKQLIYDPIQLNLTEFLSESESTEYNASEFKLNNLQIKFRTAKVTPTKTGQFVTFWKRQETGPIQPYDFNDTFDFLVISTKYNHHFGKFVIPKLALLNHGVLSTKEKEGKRAMRVYPPWNKPSNLQALKTQNWQLHYFLDMSDNNINFDRVKMLYR